MKMKSQRQLEAGELIKRKLSQILTKGISFDEKLIDKQFTISEVSLSPDFRNATIFIIEIGKIGTDSIDSIDALNEHKKKLRTLLSKMIRLKYTPELHFKEDETFNKSMRLSQIFHRLENEPKYQGDDQ
jgi:ribosome-binding factor A